MKLFKEAFKKSNTRWMSDEIYNGFGFRHLSDVTSYYVHPDSISRKTALSQPIAEAVSIFTDLYAALMFNDRSFGDVYYSDDLSYVHLDLFMSEEHRDRGLVDGKVHSYKAALVDNSEIHIAAYDRNGSVLEDIHEDEMVSLNKFLPAFCLLLARDILEDVRFRMEVEDFCINNDMLTFIKINENFYQKNKEEDFTTDYGLVFDVDRNSYSALSKDFEKGEKKAEKEERPLVFRFRSEEFSDSQLELIPDLSEEFVLPENLEYLCNAVTNEDVLSVLFHGPAGTGKTMNCKLICQECRLPLMETINCTENLDEFVLGKYIPEGDRIIFKESYVTKAIREGGAVVFEEINFARPQYLSFLNSLLDDNGFVRLDNGEVVRRHRNFRFFATMNVGYFGTRELNQALYNRFNTVFEIKELDDNAIRRMLIARVPQSRQHVTKMLKVYHKIKKAIEKEGLDIVISPRNLENWARMAKYEGYVEASEKTIVPVARNDRVMENTIRGIIKLFRW